MLHALQLRSKVKDDASTLNPLLEDSLSDGWFQVELMRLFVQIVRNRGMSLNPLLPCDLRCYTIVTRLRPDWDARAVFESMELGGIDDYSQAQTGRRSGS